MRNYFERRDGENVTRTKVVLTGISLQWDLVPAVTDVKNTKLDMIFRNKSNFEKQNQ